MNIKQIITLVVGFLLTLIASKFNVGLPAVDVQNGIIAGAFLIYCLVAKDANSTTSMLLQKSTWTGIIGSIFWIVTAIFHVNLGDGVKETVMVILGSLQGYYTLNHSSAVHEIQGTVGVPSPTFNQ